MLRRDVDAEQKLYDALRASFGTDERTGVHLSALLNPLQEHWRRIDGRPPLTDAEIGYFTAGRGHEDILTRLLKDDFESTPEEEIDGIHLRPDFLAKNNKIIPQGMHAEFKTRRSNLPKTDEEAERVFQSYRDQVRGYMALKCQNEMYLIVLSLLEGRNGDPLNPTRPVIAVYKEEMTIEELMTERLRLRNVKTLLESGVTSMLPLCWDFLCGKWEKVKNNTNPPGYPPSRLPVWQYIPKCPFYDKCRPQLRDPKRGVSYARPETSRPGLSGQGLPTDPLPAEGQGAVHPVEGLSRTPSN